ncbi:hypothetical protein [Hymenobacter lapidiphilus]|uniref:Uncharacterized protein n=1 Tax=Hymenobacter lapidiphilus TaxID=2608003 RepID=A0A7Y7PT35_9BACT|nr:hypothetical protein [Hymenobacter lapidiphilus]NVO33548.1 hypothetical protein [Hymenobacter lapidiphilus]
MNEPLDRDKLKVKVATCPKCKGWILVSCFPRCEQSAGSRREFAKCIKAGDTIDVITLTEMDKLSYCDCKSKAKKATVGSDLFSA